MNDCKEIKLDNELIEIDDVHSIKYRYKDLKITCEINNNIRTFTLPTKYANVNYVTLNDDEAKVLYNILHQIYGEDE